MQLNAYYLGNAAEGQPSDSNTQGNLAAEPTAVLTGFDEFKTYQETHPGLTAYVFNDQPAPPGSTPASSTTGLPLTGDTFAGLSWMVLAAIGGAFALSTGWILHRKREL